MLANDNGGRGISLMLYRYVGVFIAMVVVIYFNVLSKYSSLANDNPGTGCDGATMIKEAVVRNPYPPQISL